MISGEHPLLDILFDPQTAGPLLATIPKNQATALLAESNDLVVIGEIIATEGSSRIFI